MAAPKRTTKKHRLEIGLEPEQYAAKTDPTGYVRRLIEEALKKQQGRA